MCTCDDFVSSTVRADFHDVLKRDELVVVSFVLMIWGSGRRRTRTKEAKIVVNFLDIQDGKARSQHNSSIWGFHIDVPDS